jgi:subtilisin family serine protease
LRGRRYARAAFGAQLTGAIFGPAPYRPVASVAGSSLACDALPAGSLAGTIALIERGTCSFTIKVLNAQTAGAIAAMVYNSEEGGEAFVLMGADAQAEAITIPAVFVQRSLGVGMTGWWATAGDVARVQLDRPGRVIESVPDVLAGFSSRGPTFQGSLKPDVVAPGVKILSSGFAAGEGLAVHLGCGTVSGTSMAAPHVAGGAALLRQVIPTGRLPTGNVGALPLGLRRWHACR